MPVPADRKLGNEWLDWNGDPRSNRTETPAWVFLLLAGGACILLSLAGWAAAWLIAPRMLVLGVPWLAEALAGIWMAYLAAWYLALVLAAGEIRSFKSLIRLMGGVRWMVDLSVRVGRLSGFSRDRVSHAFLKIRNRLEKLPRITDAQRLLVLVPRCLDAERMQALRRLQEQYGYSQVVATGGNEARQAIEKIKPQGILAIACERDLLSGVNDIRDAIPVISLTNARPQGPCKNTVVDMKEVEKTIKRFLGFNPGE